MARQEGYSSLRAFARLHDCRLSAVQKAIKSGRVPEHCLLRDGRGFVVGIHAVNAWAEWLRNTDQGEGVKSGMEYPTASSSTRASTPLMEQAAAASLPVGELQGGTAPLPDGLAVLPLPLPGAEAGAGLEASAASGEAGFQEHRTKREKFLAEQAELDYLAKIGALVSVAQVERETAEIFSELKSNVFRIVPKKSAILAAETDPGRIERLLTDALTQAFNESSLAFADSSAGGVEERAVAVS